MNFKTTIVLLVLLAAVGIYLLIDRMGSDKGKSDTETPEDAAALVALKADDVTKVTITPADGERIVLVKKDAKWRIQEPVDAPAKGYQVDSLVQSLVDLKSRGQLEASAATGLDKPSFKVELVGKDAKTAALNVGVKTAVGDVMYVQMEARKRADIVSASAHEKLSTPLAELREELLLNIPREDIRQISITRPEGRLSLQKTDGNWQITEPQKMPADSSAVDSLLYAIVGLRAVEFVSATSEQVSTAQFDKPQMSVWVSTVAPTTQPSTTAPATSPAGTTVAFGRFEDVRKQNVFVKVSDTGQVATVGATSLDSFRKKPLDLRDKKVVQIDPQTVSAITIAIDTPATTQPTTREAVQRDVKIERRKENLAAGPVLPTTNATTQPTTAEAPKPLTQWTLTGGADANDERVKAVVDAFNPLRADKFLESSTPATQPVDRYVVTITTQAAGGASTQEHQLRLSAQEGAGKPLIGVYDNLTFELPSSFADKLTADFTATTTAPAAPAPAPAVAPAP
jgi:hypothetical protein